MRRLAFALLIYTIMLVALVLSLATRQFPSATVVAVAIVVVATIDFWDITRRAG